MSKLAVNGILLLDKPQGRTSNAVLQQVSRLFNAQKAGHAGTLDPMATGMLPICFGEATKFCQYLLDADKCYEVTGLLGSKTNTGDATGDVIATDEHWSVTKEQLQAVIEQFLGPIQQTPSMFSALKHQGKPLYHYARKGIDIQRPPRTVVIHAMVLHTFDKNAFTLTVSCSKGTYIRNLIEDIGEKLGTLAHVSQLHRCYTSGLENDPMYSLSAIESASDRMKLLLPVDHMLRYFPEKILQQNERIALQQGQVLREQGLSEGLVRLYDETGVFMGLGEGLSSGELKAKRLCQHQNPASEGSP